MESAPRLRAIVNPTIGVETVDLAAADGHHIGIIANSIISDTFLRANRKWSCRDLDSLAFINSEPVVWLVSSNRRYKDRSLKEILQEARQKPNDAKVSVISGTLFEMLAEQVEAASGVSFIKVPYPGGSASLNALMGEHIDLSFGFVGEFESLGDRVRPVAVASAKPADRLPGVPTFDAVLGTQGTQWLFWRFVAAPRGLAPERRAWLVAALSAALDDPALREDYRKRGANIDRAGLEEPFEDGGRTRAHGSRGTWLLCTHRKADRDEIAESTRLICQTPTAWVAHPDARRLDRAAGGDPIGVHFDPALAVVRLEAGNFID